MAALGIGELVVLVALASGLVFHGPEKLKAPRDDGAAAVNFVLADADVVVHFNLEALVANGYRLLDEVEKLKLAAALPGMLDSIALARMSISQGLSGAGTAFGLALERQVGSMTISVAMSEQDNIRMLVRTRGEFKGANLMALMTSQVAGSYDFKGVTIYKLNMDFTRTEHVVCTPDDTTVLLGVRTAVEQIISAKAVTGDSKSRPAQLKKLVKPGTMAFVLLSLPVWVREAMRDDSALSAVAQFLDGTDYLFLSSAPKRGLLQIQALDDESGRRAGHLLRAMAGMVNTLAPLLEAGIQGILGLVPLLPPGEEDRPTMEALANEELMTEFAGWLKKSFIGTAKAGYDGKTRLASLELSNPASVVVALAPMALGSWLGERLRQPATAECDCQPWQDYGAEGEGLGEVEGYGEQVDPYGQEDLPPPHDPSRLPLIDYLADPASNN